jgi:hypothetical protein
MQRKTNIAFVLQHQELLIYTPGASFESSITVYIKLILYYEELLEVQSISKIILHEKLFFKLVVEVLVRFCPSNALGQLAQCRER